MNRQTLLPVSVDSEGSFDNFITVGNETLVSELERLALGDGGRPALFFWGERGAGKTHLLTAACRLAAASGRPARYLTPAVGDWGLADAAAPEPGMLVAIDDLQLLCGDRNRQVALLGLFEGVTSRHGSVAVAAAEPLGELSLELADLASRLSLGGHFHIAMLDEAGRRLALRTRATQKGFTLDERVVDFIMNHYRRDTASLFALLERIDNASLEAHRKVTVPLVRSLL